MKFYRDNYALTLQFVLCHKRIVFSIAFRMQILWNTFPSSIITKNWKFELCSTMIHTKNFVCFVGSGDVMIIIVKCDVHTSSKLIRNLRIDHPSIIKWCSIETKLQHDFVVIGMHFFAVCFKYIGNWNDETSSQHSASRVYVCIPHRILFVGSVYCRLDWNKTNLEAPNYILTANYDAFWVKKRNCSAESSNENENWCNLGILPHCRSLSVTLLSIIIKRFQGFNSRWFLICKSSCPSLGFMSGRYDAYHYTIDSGYNFHIFVLIKLNLFLLLLLLYTCTKTCRFRTSSILMSFYINQYQFQWKPLGNFNCYDN